MRKVLLCFTFVFVLGFGAAGISQAAGPTLKKITAFDLPGPAGKRFDYLTIDEDDHYLISAHLAAGETYVIDVGTNKVVAVVTDTPGVEGVEYVPELKKFYTSNAHHQSHFSRLQMDRMSSNSMPVSAASMSRVIAALFPLSIRMIQTTTASWKTFPSSMRSIASPLIRRRIAFTHPSRKRTETQSRGWSSMRRSLVLKGPRSKHLAGSENSEAL